MHCSYFGHSLYAVFISPLSIHIRGSRFFLSLLLAIVDSCPTFTRIDMKHSMIIVDQKDIAPKYLHVGKFQFYCCASTLTHSKQVALLLIRSDLRAMLDALLRVCTSLLYLYDHCNFESFQLYDGLVTTSGGVSSSDESLRTLIIHNR